MKRLSEYRPNEIVNMFRNRFSGIEGNLVLEHILDAAGVFDMAMPGAFLTVQAEQTTEQAALRAFGMWILNQCGINNSANQLEIVKALFEAVPVQTFEDKENEE